MWAFGQYMSQIDWHRLIDAVGSTDVRPLLEVCPFWMVLNHL